MKLRLLTSQIRAECLTFSLHLLNRLFSLVPVATVHFNASSQVDIRQEHSTIAHIASKAWNCSGLCFQPGARTCTFNWAYRASMEQCDGTHGGIPQRRDLMVLRLSGSEKPTSDPQPWPLQTPQFSRVQCSSLVVCQTPRHNLITVPLAMCRLHTSWIWTSCFQQLYMATNRCIVVERVKGAKLHFSLHSVCTDTV